jgi:hypothetical protein
VAARDGVGAPRRQSTLAREQLIMAEAHALHVLERRGLRYEDAVRVCLVDGQPAPTRKQINYTLERLARDGRLERRGGYNWYPVAAAS